MHLNYFLELNTTPVLLVRSIVVMFMSNNLSHIPLHIVKETIRSAIVIPFANMVFLIHVEDMWAVGCIFAELLTLKPLFQGQEVKGTPNPFQVKYLSFL